MKTLLDGEQPSVTAVALLEPLLKRGIATEQRGNPDDPGPTALWTETWVKVIYRLSVIRPQMRAQLATVLGSSRVAVADVSSFS